MIARHRCATYGALTLAVRGRIGWAVVKRFMLSPAGGATITIYLAASPKVAGVCGGYFVKQRPARPNPRGEDPNLAARIRDILEALTRSDVTAY